MKVDAAREIRKSYNSEAAGVVNDGLIHFQKLRQVAAPAISHVITRDVISSLTGIFIETKMCDVSYIRLLLTINVYYY